MVAFLRGRASDRKLRLFTAACCRRVWHLLADERSRQAVEAGERYADGLLGLEELTRAEALAEEAAHAARMERSWPPEPNLDAVNRKVAAAEAAEGVAFRNLVPEFVSGSVLLAIGTDSIAEVSRQCAVLRCVVGNPFRHPATDMNWRSWNGGMVVQLAEAAYEERSLPDGTLARERLAVLADALEDAGCDDAEILGHCREQGAAHVRGCWVLDLILGRK
jgi:hypothetical protein